MKNFMQKIFSVKKNTFVKTITIFGVKIKVKNISINTLKTYNKKLDEINDNVVKIFQYLSGIQLNKDYMHERLIVFDPKDVTIDHWERYQFAKNNIKDKAIVGDIACTCGYGSKILSEKASKVIGVDINPYVVNFANKVYGNDKITFLCQDAQNLDLHENFENIVSFETIEHIPNPELFLSKVYELLNNGGKLICSVPNEITHPHKSSSNHFHFRHFTEKEFINLLESFGFIIENVYHQYFNQNSVIKEKSNTEGDVILAVAVKK